MADPTYLRYVLASAPSVARSEVRAHGRVGVVGEVFLARDDGASPSYRYIGAEARRRGDWESLGDLGWLDADGYLYLATDTGT